MLPNKNQKSPSFKAIYIRELFDNLYRPVEIAKLLGISKERVRQHLLKTGDTKHYYLKTCRKCHRRFEDARGVLCLNCVTRGPRYFQPEISLKCEICEKEFSLSKGEYQQRMKRRKHITGFFHDKKCYGKWLGKNFGIGKTRQNTPLLSSAE